ncbi:MAG: hypothetical protein IKP22_13945 [Clostridia bacterium]|nr:hypothetical protein [Clostridia bacterium]
MIDAAEYRKIISELMDELPEAFFRDLTGGVIISDAAPVPDYARDGDLYIMGHYRVSSGVRQIVMYRGSFCRAYPCADAEEARRILRGILRHEFRHHMESLGGVWGPDSLAAEDEREKQAYLAERGDREKPSIADHDL